MKLPKELTTVTTLSRIVAVIVFIAIMIIGFGIGINYQETIELILKQNKPQPTTISKPTAPISDETANWKIYRNEEFGFEVKYPEKVSFSEEKYAKDLIRLTFNNGDVIRIKVGPTEKTSVRELYFLNSQHTSLGNYEALESLPDSPPFNWRMYTLIYFKKQYELQITGNVDRLKEILSTFKFTTS